jgi:hypothetical protein
MRGSGGSAARGWSQSLGLGPSGPKPRRATLCTVDNVACAVGMTRKRLHSLAGRLVKIITCAHDLPDHIGQVGHVGRPNPRHRTVRVYLESGICQATKVVPAKDTEIGAEPMQAHSRASGPRPAAEDVGR